MSATARLSGRVPGAQTWLGAARARQAGAAPDPGPRMVGWSEVSAVRQEDLAEADHCSVGEFDTREANCAGAAEDSRLGSTSRCGLQSDQGVC